MRAMRAFAVAVATVLVTACAEPAASVPTASVAPPSATVAHVTPTATFSVAPNASAAPSVPNSPTPAVPSSPTRIPMPSFASLSAPSANVVWALVAGDHLFRSIDRGSTWEARPLPDGQGGSSPRISFIDDRGGWLLKGFQPATGCQQQEYELWHTSDAGASWTMPDIDPNARGPLFGQCKRAVAFVDRLRGVVTATARGTRAAVYRTADGGKTWSRTFLPDPPGYVNNDTYPPEPDRVRWIGATLFVDAVLRTTGDNVHYVYRSTDGGASWSIVATIEKVNGALAFATATRWLQLGLAATSRETADAGATWHSYATSYSQAAPVAPLVDFAGADVGYATVRGGIQRTTDGGAHWATIRTPGT